MKRNIKKIGDKCRHCDTPVIFRESRFKKSKLKKPYYYAGYLKCTTCRAMYMVEDYKVINKKKKNNKIKEKWSLKELKIMDYNKYLKTGHWKNRRLEYYKTHKKICFCCNSESYVLHHINYSNRGKEKDKDLLPLCETCHNDIHDLIINEPDITLKNAHTVKKQLIELNN